MHLMKNGKKKKKQLRDMQTNRHIWKLKFWNTIQRSPHDYWNNMKKTISVFLFMRSDQDQLKLE